MHCHRQRSVYSCTFVPHAVKHGDSDKSSLTMVPLVFDPFNLPQNIQLVLAQPRGSDIAEKLAKDNGSYEIDVVGFDGAVRPTVQPPAPFSQRVQASGLRVHRRRQRRTTTSLRRARSVPPTAPRGSSAYPLSCPSCATSPSALQRHVTLHEPMRT